MTGNRASPAADKAPGLSGQLAGRFCAGVGMMEFLVALLIFSMSMMAILSIQLVGKKATFEASQRSTATALARDILERIYANSGQAIAYRVSGIGDDAKRLPLPDVDCAIAACTAQQLAAFDLWQWESLLLGYAEQDATGFVGGLLSPRACIDGASRVIDVSISWRSVLSGSPDTEPDCGIDVEGQNGDAEAPQRRQLSVSTFLAGA